MLHAPFPREQRTEHRMTFIFRCFRFFCEIQRWLTFYVFFIPLMTDEGCIDLNTKGYHEV